MVQSLPGSLYSKVDQYIRVYLNESFDNENSVCYAYQEVDGVPHLVKYFFNNLSKKKKKIIIPRIYVSNILFVEKFK